MKKIFCVIITLLCFTSPAMSASRQELKLMSTFLSNFTELSMYNFNIDTISDKELVRFGIWHNYHNNYRSRIEDCPRGNKCPYGEKVIHKKYVAESVRKFFDVDLNHQSILHGHYDGTYYHFPAADGEIPYYAEVQSVSKRGNLIIMRGELYNAEDEEERAGNFTATAKPYRYNGKNTWSIISLESD